MKRAVHINDSVHQNIYLEPFQQQIVATPQFQRLHRLKQLGSAYNVYPTATHTRFAHCLGVGHLAGKMYDSILSEQPELRAAAYEMDRKLVVAAGMMHDLGHGPHSHAFECWVHSTYPQLHFNHEEMSIKLIRNAHEQGALPFLDEEDKSDPGDAASTKEQRAERRLQAIAHMIAGTAHEKVSDDCIAPEKRWMLDIVSNSMCGFDVDRVDYLMRDTQVVFGSPPASINLDRILKMARVLGGRICFHRKVASNLYQLLQLRLTMHQTVYGHKTCLIVELMQRDVLDELDHVLNIGERLDSPERYLLLDDGLFQIARYLHQQTTWMPQVLLEGGARREQAVTRRRQIDLSLARAIRILDDIDARRLYVAVTSSIVDGETWKLRDGKRGIPSKQEVYAAIPCATLAQQLQIEDLIIETRCFNYGKGDQNPMTAPMFFDWGDTTARRVKAREISHIMPRQFSEYKVWLFCKRHDLTKEQLDFLREAFHHCMYTQTTPTPSGSLAASSATAVTTDLRAKRKKEGREEEEEVEEEDGAGGEEEQELEDIQPLQVSKRQKRAMEAQDAKIL